MKIWIDITNSPHVNFFAGIIREIKQDHQIIITCRPLANTIELLNIEGFSYFIIGRHYGRNPAKKIIGFLIRITQLYLFLKNHLPEVAVSHSSFYSPVVARMLGIKCVYLNDNEHAGGNRISFKFADTIMVPEYLSLNKIKRQGADLEKVVQYPGLKEGIYLWRMNGGATSLFSSSDTKRGTIFIRPEPWSAQYYKGACNFLDETLIALKDDFKVILLPRGDIQKNYYMHKRFKGLIVVQESISLADIMKQCALFIGAGGTMTREAAVLGIPTISIYQDDLLDVDKYLIQKGAMAHIKELSPDFVKIFLQDRKKNPADQNLLNKGHQACDLIKKTIIGE